MRVCLVPPNRADHADLVRSLAFTGDRHGGGRERGRAGRGEHMRRPTEQQARVRRMRPARKARGEAAATRAAGATAAHERHGRGDLVQLEPSPGHLRSRTPPPLHEVKTGRPRAVATPTTGRLSISDKMMWQNLSLPLMSILFVTKQVLSSSKKYLTRYPWLNNFSHYC